MSVNRATKALEAKHTTQTTAKPATCEKKKKKKKRPRALYNEKQCGQKINK